MSEPYRPVACALYDRVEAAALGGRPVAFVVREADGAEAALTDTIADVFARGGADWARLGSGREVRLDRLRLADGA